MGCACLLNWAHSFSWSDARLQSPCTAISWNSWARRSASAGWRRIRPWMSSRCWDKLLSRSATVGLVMKAPRKETRSRRTAYRRAPQEEKPGQALADFLVLLDVPGHQAFRALAALLGLLPVLLLDLGRLERVVHHHGFRVQLARQLHRRHQHVFKGDLGVFDLLAAGLANRQFDPAQVLAAGAVLHDGRGRLVDARNDMQVVEAGFAGAQAAAAGHVAGLSGAPRKRNNVRPVL